MDYVVLSAIGLVMGLFGGMLGIGGSLIMIPALTLYYGQNQHLYQASAMICNFFVAVSSVIVHRKMNSLVRSVLTRLIPTAIVGILAGVWFSNASFFAAEKSYLLARIFGLFLLYVALYNIARFFRPPTAQPVDMPQEWSGLHNAGLLSAAIGLVTGLGAGFLGIGAGSIATPFQQVVLKMPLKKAMSNSAAAITSIALVGALYKNMTLDRHGIELSASLRMAVVIIPTAIAGGFLGGKLMHTLPKNIVRAVFIIVLLLAAMDLITVKS